MNTLERHPTALVELERLMRAWGWKPSRRERFSNWINRSRYSLKHVTAAMMTVGYLCWWLS